MTWLALRPQTSLKSTKKGGEKEIKKKTEYYGLNTMVTNLAIKGFFFFFGFYFFWGEGNNLLYVGLL